jgi:branched-chain amino acid transport system ATP-binding protein
MQVAERAVVLRLGRVIWDSPVGEVTHDDLGELFMTGRLSRDASHLEPTATPIT